MAECPICATGYEEGSIEICSNCGFDLTPFPEFIGEYPTFWAQREQTQIDCVRQMWLNFEETKQKLLQTIKTQSECHKQEIKKLNSQLKQNENTISQLNNQIKTLRSEKADHYFELGIAYKKLKEYQKAREDYQQAANLYQKQGNNAMYQKVIELFNNLLN